MILILIILFCLYPVYGQLEDYTFSGDFDRISFDRFVDSIENTSDLNFYYLSKWTSGISITARGDNLSLKALLVQYLEQKKLSFYIDQSNNVFIIPGTIIAPETDSAKVSDRDERETGLNASGITKEEMYFGGGKEEVTETITIGESNGAAKCTGSS